MQGQGRRAGFTLIELVIAITILGILAAFALPRFVSLEVDVRSAATQALAGSIRSSSALSHALWLAQGQPSAVTMEGAEIAIVNGYPSLATIDDSLSDLTGFTYDAATGVFGRLGTTSGCAVTYGEAASAGDVPTVEVTVSGC